jgi:hypothetical protein
MTLGELLNFIGNNPLPAIGYFSVIPLTALLAGLISKGVVYKSPWKYLYASLIYAVCIPGMFAVVLTIYQFMFGRRDIMNANVISQIIPMVSMGITLGVMRKYTPFSAIPGFGRLSGLMMLTAAIFMVMYLMDRMHLVAFVRLPVEVLLAIVLGALILFRLALARLSS